MIAIAHVGLAMPDIEKAIDWYIDVLDFRLIAGIEMASAVLKCTGRCLLIWRGFAKK